MGTCEWLDKRKREEEREGEMECLALRRCYNWQWWCSAAMQSHSRSLAWASRKRTPSWTPLAFLYLLFSHHLFDLLSSPPSLFSISYNIRLWYRTAATLLPISGLKSEISTRISNSKRLIRISNFYPSAVNINIFYVYICEMKTG